MIQNRLITITDICRFHNGDERTQMITHGSLTGGPEDYTLCFREMLDDESECTTHVNVKNRKCVTLLRSGAYNSELMIEQGRRHNCHYATPYGDLMVGVFAKSVDSRVNVSGGKLRLHYTVDFYGSPTTEKILVVDVSPRQDGKQSKTGKEKSGKTVVRLQPPRESK